MRVKLMLAALALAVPLLATGCGTTCGHHGNSGCCGPTPVRAASVPVAPIVPPAPAPCCNGGAPAPLPTAPGQPSYSSPFYPSNGARP
jgi:hypothetical protein